jgi:hypothetical protein
MELEQEVRSGRAIPSMLRYIRIRTTLSSLISQTEPIRKVSKESSEILVFWLKKRQSAPIGIKPKFYPVKAL